MGDEQRIEDSRTAPRFSVTAPVGGFFGAAAVRLLSISATGAQIEHSAPVKPGSRGRVGFNVRERVFTFTGDVVWSRLSKHLAPDGKPLYRSGLRSSDPHALETLIGALDSVRFVERDQNSLERKRQKLAERRQARQAISQVKLLTSEELIQTDELLLIMQARDRLRLNPEEATKWYNRAKFSMAEYVGQHDSSFREEVFAIWEYLERTVDLGIIARVLDKRQ
jgi:hypothetical protein